MPWGMFMACAWDFLRAQVKRGGPKPRMLEEYFYRKRGRRLIQIFSQGFQEKLTGTKWANIPLADDASATDDEGGLVETLRQLIVRLFSTKEVNTFKGIWRHPARGTGQLCDSLARGILDYGGR